MDPLTHALLGATVAQAALGPRLGRPAWMIGALGGLLPDADILIRSAADPLLAIEYHRHFTHSFAFIPIGGFLASLPWLAQKRYRPNWRALFAAGSLGYATHGLLDACTNYGTHLLWPFSPLRVSWHWVTTVGPLLTLLLLVGLIVSARRTSRRPALIALSLGFAYIGAAAIQRERALEIQERIATARGHPIVRAEMFPTVGNPFMWRSTYQSGNTLHTDRIRVTTNDKHRWKPGGTVTLLGEQDLPETQTNERIRNDLRRFSYFSAGWVARAADDPTVIGDARYSLRTDRFEPIWGVRFHPDGPLPTEWVDRTIKNRIPIRDLWEEISGNAPGYRTVD